MLVKACITSGQQKTSVSVCLTAGTKLKPLILLPRKRPLKNWIPPNSVEILYSTSGNFNESVIEHFVPKMLVSYNEDPGDSESEYRKCSLNVTWGISNNPLS